MNYPQFIDLRVNGELISTQLVTLEFTPSGQVVNNNEIIFPISRRIKGKPSVHVINAALKLNIDEVDLRPGNTLKLSVHQVCISLHEEP